MLRRTKVLVVLDGVNDLQQLNYLIGSTLDWFGNGSRIIITSGDKQVLVERGVDIYEVKPLDFDDSLRLFNMHAFEQNHAYLEEYYELSKMMVKHAAGIPSALEHLGLRLRGKDKEAWEKQLGRLKKRVPIKEVHEIFKLSYNDLDHHEKKILLDIACFFDGLHLKNDDIQLLVKDRDYSLADELDSLINKALVTISPDNVVSMLDIIQQTALKIVREESNDDPAKQSRLQDPDDIYYVLKNNKGSEAIRSLAIDVSMIKEVQLNPKVFAKMNKLRYLDIYSNGYSYDFLRSRGGLNLSQGLEYLPNEVRYLRWARFPLESLPCTFSGEKLVVLDLQYSRVRKLWHDNHKLRSLPKLPSSLITLNVSDCVSLENVTFPSTAVQIVRENKRRVAFWNCLKLDQHSLKAIGLNAQINIKKFAYQHISISRDHDDYDAQGTYVYPGSNVPEWLVYRTTRYYMTIDLSFVNHSSPLAFIFCFIVPQVESPGFILRVNIGVDEVHIFELN
ncbi:hypothetical protein TSUD_357980 [Trifolium subterraneum]|uniref:Disease resistance protein Roq1-like winged-helix domain-containing protein n=1 Tax=Trifolium subterraneum TaxID=3900 RepID=A0A2Z6MHS5_TRISU|nr:hypothetical protein TSUD_357980 [Trifolium subterraneum]